MADTKSTVATQLQSLNYRAVLFSIVMAISCALGMPAYGALLLWTPTVV